jgi:hypothetical protein
MQWDAKPAYGVSPAKQLENKFYLYEVNVMFRHGKIETNLATIPSFSLSTNSKLSQPWT